MSTSIDTSQTKQKYCIVHGKLHSAQNRAETSSLSATCTFQTLPSFSTVPQTEAVLTSWSETGCSHAASLLKEG